MPPGIFDAQQIIEEAQRVAGIADSEPFVLDNLRRLVDSLRAESGMSEQGFTGARRMFVNDTVNRLEGLKWLRDHPAIADEPIDAPVFLMGLPRSGTTLLQYLFSCDPRFRFVRTWEALSPSPPPGFDPSSAASRRAAWAERRRKLATEVENLQAMHLYDEDGPEECHAFLEQSFGAAGLNNIYRVPGYFDYLMDEADLASSYRVHKRQLQLLQWRNDTRPWVLKYPNHVIALDELRSVYPDARLVMTHRDPLQTLASISKLTHALRTARTERAVDKHGVGQCMTHFIQRHVDRIMAADSAASGSGIVHVDYYALVRDPVAAMGDAYRQLGIEFTQEARRAVANWHDANPMNARGANDYGIGEYGLDEAALETRFGDYMQRFAIPRERDAQQDLNT